MAAVDGASDETVKAACAKVQELDLRLAKAEKDFAAKDAKLQELNERIAAYDASLRQLDHLIAIGKKEKKDREATWPRPRKNLLQKAVVAWPRLEKK